MRISITTYEEMSVIEVISYEPEDYKQLLGIMNGISELYPWYYYEKDGQHSLVHFGGWLKHSDNELDIFLWKYNKSIKEEK